MYDFMKILTPSFMLYVYTKGQIISKRYLVSSDSSKKMNERIRFFWPNSTKNKFVRSCFWKNPRIPKTFKGQLISKCLFDILRFFQKTNKQIRFQYCQAKKPKFIRSFFGRIRGYQKWFRNYLTFTKGTGGLQHHKFLIFDGKQHPKNIWFHGC